MPKNLTAGGATNREPIAIIGIGCRFPGGVTDAGSFWSLLESGRDAITEIPPDRFDVDAFFDPTPATPGKIMSRWGGFIADIDRFDAAAFGISPREAERLDPQQRLLLEVSAEALADAGVPVERLAGSQTGVFVGVWLSDYEARLFDEPRDVDFYMTTGSGRYSASGRLSYAFGFQGPSLTVDTACSSSLVAVHLACRSLWAGDCTVALAGGANVILQPHITIAYSQSRMMAPDGRCKFGDSRADGYVRSDGAGVVVLKPLGAALADGDPIYAVIRGGAVNNDGRTSGFMTTPGSAGQEEMLRKAYADAGVAPGRIRYVEAHGTGTRAGDPVEIGALGQVLAEGRPAGAHCRVGSVKTNIGHTEGAAGVAGLIKVALALHHDHLPASLNCLALNPEIPWPDLPVELQREPGAWPEGSGPKLAGVSAFGIAGTNAHVVLEEAPTQNVGRTAAPSAYLLPLSAQSPEALQAVALQYQDVLRTADAADVCYTAAVRRSHHEYRHAIVGRSAAELARGLAETPTDTLEATRGRPRIVFVFPGQGSQWAGMGRDLLAQSPVFRTALEECDAALRPYTDWSLLDQLTAADANARLDEIDVIQPTLFALEVALAAVWQDWGVRPDAVVGHSMGEAAAAYVSGALSLADAAALICRRSQLMKRLSGRGAMAVVELSLTEAESAVAAYAGRLGVAVNNGPRSTVISGEPEALAALVADLQRRDVFCRPVKVDVAAHSPQMDPLRPELVSALAGLRPRAATVPMFSTVTGHAISGEDLDAAYWGRNLREPVRFDTAIRDLTANGHDLFIEISPHPVLLPALPADLRVVPSLRRGEPELDTLLSGAGVLFTSGYPIAWERLQPAGRPLRLPSYPWQKERFWYERPRRRVQEQGHRAGLLGPRFSSALPAGPLTWESILDLDTFGYLADHRVRGSVMFPASGFVELCLAAAQDLFGGPAGSVEDLVVSDALLLDQARCVQVVVTAGTGGGARDVRVYSRPASQTGPDGWTLHAVGRLAGGSGAPTDSAATIARESIVRLRDSLTVSQPAAKHYADMALRRLDYGPAFQGIDALLVGETEVLARLRLPAEAAATPEPGPIHPALLDAAFQLLLTLEPDFPTDAFLPVHMERVAAWARVPAEVWAYARRTADDDLIGDVVLLDDEDRVLVEVRGLRLQRVTATHRFDVGAHAYAVHWHPVTLANGAPSASAPPDAGPWLMVTETRTPPVDALLAELGRRHAACTLIATGTVSNRDHGARPGDDADDLAQALTLAVAPDGYRGLVMFANAAPDPDDAPTSALAHSTRLLWLVQTLARADQTRLPRLWLVTTGALAVAEGDDAPAPDETALWGLAGTISHELPEMRCVCVDLSRSAPTAEVATLADVMLADPSEDRIALRGARTYAARLQRAEIVRRSPPIATAQAVETLPFRIEPTQPGLLETFGPRACARLAPAPGQVEIEVQVTGLNFINVLSALAMCPGMPDGIGPLGLECAGIVTRVGAGVSAPRVGDAVLAVAHHCLASHALADARLTAPKPEGLSFEQAGTLPIVYLTAHYALNHLARLQRGERVLIHAAAGGVGLAAVQLARHVGAEVFATAGSAEKRDYLRQLGVRHVFDSRTLAFADDVMAATAGEGVDVVLNSLTGEAIAKGLAVLRPFGRFIEIGKRDIYDNTPLGLWPFQNNLAYFAVDLERMSREHPARLGGLLTEVLELLADGAIAPLPVRIFAASQAAEAFAHMAQARQIGKVAIDLRDQAGLELDRLASTAFRSDGCYVVTGGLGGLGLAVAGWMVERGARHLALLGRHAPRPETLTQLAALERQGATVRLLTADVADAAQLGDALTELARGPHPVRGVVHAAGSLDDGVLMQQDATRFATVFGPKVLGAWNLHRLTHAFPLDFFVLFSSIASVLGTPGQGNYAAANAFMDGLAHVRRQQGLPALSLNWGPWATIGLAAQRGRGGRLAAQGVASLSPDEGLAALEQALAAENVQLAVMRFDAGTWLAAHPRDDRASLFTSLATEATNVAAAGAPVVAGIRAALEAAEPGRARQTVFETYLREQAARVLRLAPTRIDPHKPLRALGFDSLMTIEFRNRLEVDLGLALPATLVWNYPTVAELAPHLAERLGLALATPTQAPADRDVDALAALSANEVERLLADELDAIDALMKGQP